MTSTTERRTRQYRVTHIPTGIVTVVQAPESHGYTMIITQAGLWHPFDTTVEIVPEGQEIPLPWDLPLVLRPRVA